MIGGGEFFAMAGESARVFLFTSSVGEHGLPVFATSTSGLFGVYLYLYKIVYYGFECVQVLAIYPNVCRFGDCHFEKEKAWAASSFFFLVANEVAV